MHVDLPPKFIPAHEHECTPSTFGSPHNDKMEGTETPRDVSSKKTPKQQLSKGMEHIRQIVTVSPSSPSSPPSSSSTTTTTTRHSTPTILPSTPPTALTDSAEDTQGTPAYGVPAAFEPVRKPATDLSKENSEKRADPFQFGSRYLEEGDDIFAYNAWDHVETDDAYKSFILEQTEFQRNSPVSDFDRQRFNTNPEKWWDKFYSNNRSNFFKDRKWLVQEFPVLGEVTKPDYGPATLLEIGAGAGNTAFPVLANNRNRHLKIHACDYSKKAVELIRSNEAYDGDVLRADVWDVAGTGENALPPNLQPASVDVVIMIFIFSALQPTQWVQAVKNVYNVLKPGGIVLFRDYGRGDLAQVRFKKGRYLEDNFYIRGDGTRVYFFERDELEDIWTGNMPPNALASQHSSSSSAAAATPPPSSVDAVADKLDQTQLTEPSSSSSSPEQEQQQQQQDQIPGFQITNLGVDRRMLVNRQRKLKMYRCWMQGRFQKPAGPSSSSSSLPPSHSQEPESEPTKTV